MRLRILPFVLLATLARATPPPADLSARGLRYAVVTVRHALSVDEHKQLESAGAVLLDSAGKGAYRIRFAPGAENAIRRLPFVDGFGAPTSERKIDPQLSLASNGPAPVAIRVVLDGGEPAQRVLDLLDGHDPRATAAGKDGAWRIVATVPGTALGALLDRLAALPEVEGIEPVRVIRALNQDAVWVHQSFVGPSPQQTPVFDHGIFGCGQIVGIADTAQDYDACFFRDTVNGPPPIATCSTPPCPAAAPAGNRRKDVLYYNWSGGPTGEEDTCPATTTGTSGHGTHTSGSIAGDAAPYADCAGFTTPGRNGGDGLAPGAKLVVEEMGDGFEYLNDLGGTLWNLTDVAFTTGARIHSNSWGGACYDVFGDCTPGCTMPYDSYARDADLAMWSHPDLLIVTAAGNGGAYCPAPISVGTPANAKNVLAVGSVGHGTAATTPSYFTSPGPVHDGRLAPAVAAQGESTVSAASDANLATNNCGTCSLDGSSMSAPTTAGLAALVREYYTTGFYATGARNPGSGFVPSGALLKATLIDGAVALGANTSDPDFTSGFGRIELDRTLAFTGGPFALRVDDRREGVTTGSVVSHAYDVAAGQPFRATLVWTDYPGALNADVARVNELKLEVVDPSGTTWFQTLDATSGLPVPTSNGALPHDTRNVEERLVFATPAPGRWIVRVRGIDVPFGPQPFALVVRGAMTDCPAPPAPPAPALGTPADHQVQVTWSPVSGAAGYNVYRSFGPCPGGPWVPVATAVAGTSFLDTTVSGGAAYSYVVTAASDPSAACESARSGCASVVPTGDCTLLPAFHGVREAVSDGLSACSVDVRWDPATAYCSGGLTYNVYRGTSSGFVPGPGNRVARCVSGTTFTDSVSLAYGTTYWYAVRAEDGTSGHGGPCHGGNEEANAVMAAVAPDGPPALGTWSDDAGDTGTAKMGAASPWSDDATGGHAAPHVYTGNSSSGICADLPTPTITLASPAQGPQLTFWTKHDLDYDPTGEIFGREGSVGQVEIATGPSFTGWTRVPLTPDYPETVDFPYNQCTTTQNPGNYFTGLHTTYTQYSASLANWAGGDVKIRFHLSGDLLYPGGHWWLDDLSVTQALVPGSCQSIAAGPPPVPDTMHASRSGTSVAITWDATQCPATAVNIYRGAIGSFASFNGGSCGLAPSGSATVAMPDNSWFLVVATDGGSTDGSYAKGVTGSELFYAGASSACPAIAAHVTNNACP
ncbi:MAG TPA: S8 family serine peptidase [Candidatus Polarisedimenticolaceae bacterium]|nr:S8 family serine peptidase [Candidatus Polarisedimenticolaceae bacterium]